MVYALVEVKTVLLSDRIFFNLLTPNDPYGSYRTANLQTLHFIYLFNKYTY